jgi:hypothetical protein
MDGPCRFALSRGIIGSVEKAARFATKAWLTTPWSVPECDGLITEHERLKQRYAVAVDHLFAIGYQVTDTEYRKLKNSIEEARVQSEITRERLEKHKLVVHSRARSTGGN